VGMDLTEGEEEEMKESANVEYEVLVAWCQDSPEMAAKEIIRLEDEIERLEAGVEALRQSLLGRDLNWEVKMVGGKGVF
jgi:hypothetical protein